MLDSETGRTVSPRSELSRSKVSAVGIRRRPAAAAQVDVAKPEAVAQGVVSRRWYGSAPMP